MTAKPFDPVASAVSLVELLRLRAQHQPARRVYAFEADDGTQEHLTYAELDLRARAVAARLQDSGAAGGRALLVYPPGLDYVAAVFGCLYAGTAAVPVYPPRANRGALRLLSILADARAHAVLTTTRVLAAVQTAHLPQTDAPWLATDEIPLAAAEAWRDPHVGVDTLALLQYTSGSTAAPKGVLLSHGNLLHNLGLIRDAFGMGPHSSSVIWLPPYHDMGLIGGILEPLVADYPALLMSPVTFLQNPFRWLDAVSRERATTSGGPNFAYELCARRITAEQRAGLDLSHWSVAFNGAEPVRPETLEAFARAFEPCGFRREAFLPCYGLAEGTLLVSGHLSQAPPVIATFDAAALTRHEVVAAPPDAPDSRSLVGSGPVAGTQQLVIADPESGARLPAGRVGEIWLRGPSVTRGYWNRPEESERTCQARLADGGEGPFLRTGDLGFVQDGELFVTGRIKDLIIIRGRNHYPQDVELTAERAHQALRPGCGAAFALDVAGEERLVVVYEVQRERRGADVDEVARAVRRAVADEHEVQLHAVVLIKPGSVPKTSSGKIQRHACRAGFQDGSLEVLAEWRETGLVAEAGEDVTQVDSAADLARWLRAQVATRLRVPVAEIALDQPFGQVALDSLNALELAHAVEERFGTPLALQRLFEAESLTALAEEIFAARSVGAPGDAPAATHVETGAARPLSPGQRALWFLHQLDPHGAAYNVGAAVRILGALDVAALRRAFAALIARHAPLRTTFTAEDGEPVAQVHAPGEPDFEQWDAAGWSEAELRARLDEQAHAPFDLAQGPLLRVKLLACAPGVHVLALALHHSVTDFWSLALMLRDLEALYLAEREGREPGLPPLGADYDAFARWQNDLVAGAEGERLLDYWRGQLEGELPVLDLRTDRPRPAVQTASGAALPITLGAELCDELEALARRSDATLFTVLLAAFQVLLARHAGQDGVVVGTPTTGRSRAHLRELVGYFVNPVALRADLSGDPSWSTFLARVRRTVLGALEHQDYPFAGVVEKLARRRDAGRTPIFQAMFALQAAPPFGEQSLTPFALGEERASVRWAGLTLELVPFRERVAQFDLTLNLGAVAGGLRGSLNYNTDLFDAASSARLVRHFETLLRGIVADPERRLSALPLLGADEEQRQLVEWNATAADYPRERCVHELIAEQARRTPEALAVVAGGRVLRYGELAHRARQLAARLRALGVGPETLVGICLDSSLEVVSGILGVLKAGGAWLPLDPSFPPERLAFMARDAGLRAILTLERHQATLPPEFPLLALDRELPDSPDSGPMSTGVGPDNVACAIYTSGSTGAPKGTLLTHRAVVNLITSFVRSYDVGPADRILPLTSIAYASFVGEVLPLLCAGGTVVLPAREETLDIARLQTLLAGHAVSIVSTVPALVRTLVALKLPRLRLLLAGGEALTPTDVGELPGTLSLVNGYGLTETTVCSTYHRVTPADLLAPGAISVGRPIMNTRVYVLDGGLRPVPIGTPGELYVAGDGLARCYLGRPELTAERFVPDPFHPGERMYSTGDLAARSRDGQLLFLGRRDHQVKVRGFRIDLEEIEVVLARHAAVRECAVVAREDVPGEKRLVAYVAAASGAPAGAGALIGHLRDRLPDHMIPAAFQFVGELPRTHAGKVDLRALPAPESVRPELSSAYVAPRSALERSIAGVWQELLHVDQVGLDDNFFDLGGHSLLLARLQSRLHEVLGRELSLVDLFRYPTVSALTRHLSPREDEGLAAVAPPAVRALPAAGRASEIAVIAVSGRFPGARDVEELWDNLQRGVESITFFSDEELLTAGVDPALVRNPDYIKAKGLLGDVDLFDAPFFGLAPREVELMDPQHRLLLECAHQALERAGYEAGTYPGRVGVYAGASMNTYMLTNILPGLELVASVETLQASLGNDKDPLTSRISYKLDLKGPSITIQSASSTSLVAVHVACKALLEGECDMALAGGVSVHLPEKSGYMYHEGGTTSRHGHCRAFDARADGFVPGNGVGLVVLKRLEEARRDGDNILAVIKGTACNNDGSQKISFMAPSVDGQLDVYARAHAAAGTTPDSLTYVECHGTGTALGDPIEFEALSLHFRGHTQRRQCCALGSLKTNIGHLDVAAGVCGLIKTVLSLQHRTLPPTLHFEQPNPQIDFERSPFFVNTVLRPWATDGGPRRAGVTSLGMGGTNAHVILEEAPEAEPAGAARPWQLLLLSARTQAALDSLTGTLVARLKAEPGLALPDVAYTLQMGRKRHEHRRVLVCRDTAEAVDALSTLDPTRVTSARQEPGERGLYFLFSGQGAQHVDMARDLHAHEPVFRETLDHCAELLQPHLGFDLREVLFPPPEQAEAASERLRQTAVTQPALFAVEYALATLWMRWGLRPRAMLGHSIGEYVAACLASVMSLEDALRLVAARGRLMQAMTPGSMLAVPLPEAEVRALLGRDLDLAAVNAPALTVVSGPDEAVARLEHELRARDVACRRLHTSHAFHSRSMDPMLAEFSAQVRTVQLSPPRVPYVSNVSGTWIRAEQATDPAYWAQQLRQAVRFADGLGEILSDPDAIVLEVGPGQSLTTLVRQHPARTPGQAVIASLPHALDKDERSALEHVLGALGKLWSAGAVIDWRGFHEHARRRRVVLPTYPFERQRYWVDPPAADASRRKVKAGKRPLDEWFHVPLWKQMPSRAGAASPTALARASPWLILADALGLGAALTARLRDAGHVVVSVSEGNAWREIAPGAYVIDPTEARHYEELLRATGQPKTIVHLWGLTGAAGEISLEARVSRAQQGLDALLGLGQALAAQAAPEALHLWLVGDGLFDVTGAEALQPEKATLLGAARALPWELPHVACHNLDVIVPPPCADALAGTVLREITSPSPPPVTALRGRTRWTQSFDQVALGDADAEPARLPLREQGVYLITGGLGGIGLEIASWLARTVRARLVLVGRSELPAREQWAHVLGNGADQQLRDRLGRVQALEAAGGQVLTVRADVSSLEDVQRVKARVLEVFGRVDGIVHAAGVPAASLLAAKTRASVAAVLAPKLQGTLVLEALFAPDDAGLDFFVVCSSITALLGQVGQADYAAANAFLDAWAVARARRGLPALSIGWDAWQNVGMAASTAVPAELRAWREAELKKGLLPEEGVTAFERLLRSGLTHVVVSTEDLGRRLAEKRTSVSLEPAVVHALHPRPALHSEYAAPGSPREEAIAKVWQELLGLEQVGIHDNFFELGGNSLMALSVVARLKRDLNVSLSDVSLFKAPTVSSLARLLGDEPSAVPMHDESRERGARRRAGPGRRRPAATRE